MTLSSILKGRNTVWGLYLVLSFLNEKIAPYPIAGIILIKKIFHHSLKTPTNMFFFCFQTEMKWNMLSFRPLLYPNWNEMNMLIFSPLLYRLRIKQARENPKDNKWRGETLSKYQHPGSNPSPGGWQPSMLPLDQGSSPPHVFKTL